MRFALLPILLTISVAAQTPPPAFNSVRASDSYRNALTQTAVHYEQTLSSHCPTVDLQMQAMQAKVLGPFQLDAKGDILTATWKESTPGTACQQSRLYNAAVLIRNGKPQVIPLFPGHSFAGPLLQHDASLYAVVATGTGKDCPADILDTALPTGEPAKPHDPWDEKWTVRACGKRFLVTLHFLPDATGTTIHAGFGETVVIP